MHIQKIPENTPISIRNLSMIMESGGQMFTILKDINWEVTKGNIELLMGPSGSGKTTLLSIISGILTPTSGNVYILVISSPKI